MSDNSNTHDYDFDPTGEQSLLVDRALGEIEPDSDGWREPDEFELAAAEAAVLYAQAQSEPMPEALRGKLTAAAQGVWNRSADSSPVAGSISPESQVRRAREAGELKMPPLPSSGNAPTGSSAVLSAAGWLAAAAAIAIAAVGWMRPTEPTNDDSVVVGAQSVEDRLASLESAPDTVSGDWIAWPAGTLAPDIDPREGALDVKGKFVWNEPRQEGYMVFENMPVNDPKLEQYQLWLVSADHEHPIDGGVFNIASSGRVIVPIDAKIRASNLAALGVTIEKPGGVVVSDRTDRMVAGLVPQG